MLPILVYPGEDGEKESEFAGQLVNTVAFDILKRGMITSRRTGSYA